MKQLVDATAWPPSEYDFLFLNTIVEPAPYDSLTFRRMRW